MTKKLRVWWIPQVPMPAFYVPVSSVEEGAKIMDVLADYDDFQYRNNVKPDYSNTGGLEEQDEEGDWFSWEDEETGIDDPREYLASRNG
ncbi:hypothetical protein [Pseudomonas oryzihabitans]|uniref:Superinfection exclusion protein n=1 Tax=Pseudomonas oryzihabitans TaxID=47885 RepID=A0ABX3IVD7_9PSED|nr:hypothetical protein [Pseudomonas psychrotolerans]ONN71698.1 hypothetical protein BVL52_08620 [Pseudomonas psychrotolerans]